MLVTFHIELSVLLLYEFIGYSTKEPTLFVISIFGDSISTHWNHFVYDLTGSKVIRFILANVPAAL